MNNDVDADSAVTLGWGDVDGPGRAPDVQHYGHVLRPGELGRDGGAQGEAAGRNCTTLLVKLNLFTYLRTKSLKRSIGIEP